MLERHLPTAHAGYKVEDADCRHDRQQHRHATQQHRPYRLSINLSMLDQQLAHHVGQHHRRNARKKLKYAVAQVDLQLVRGRRKQPYPLPVGQHRAQPLRECGTGREQHHQQVHPIQPPASHLLDPQGHAQREDRRVGKRQRRQMRKPQLEVLGQQENRGKVDVDQGMSCGTPGQCNPAGHRRDQNDQIHSIPQKGRISCRL